MVDGITVGSWTCGEHDDGTTRVTIMIRVARCRCRRMIFEINCVRWAVSLLMGYLCLIENYDASRDDSE